MAFRTCQAEQKWHCCSFHKLVLAPCLKWLFLANTATFAVLQTTFSLGHEYETILFRIKQIMQQYEGHKMIAKGSYWYLKSLWSWSSQAQ